MLKYKKVEIVISASNYKKYVDKYGPFNNKEKIIIDIKDLSKNSRVRVTTICELCKSENEVYYQNYNKQIKKGGYYCCHKCSSRKQKESMEKNGSKYFLQEKEKYKKIMLENYGVDNPSKIDEIKETRSKRLQNKSYQQKMLDGVKEKYNIDNVSKLEDIKTKKEETCFKNYGVRNPIQSEYIFYKSQKSGKKIKYHENTKLYYRGSYEKDFLDYCFDNGISVEKGITIEFVYNNKKKVYHSDFYIRNINTVIEIKSSYYYHKFEDLNIVKMNETINKGYNHLFIIDKNYNDLHLTLN